MDKDGRQKIYKRALTIYGEIKAVKKNQGSQEQTSLGPLFEVRAPGLQNWLSRLNEIKFFDFCVSVDQSVV